ncbi:MULTISPECIES: hypothetical protein [Bacillaceae]|jgi:hypothetical protein|uniref:hypothetical protein n=1 Tax=Bacillaceae TaxID=186817 RepID=UPI0006AF8923|nr:MULTISPECIES: hypothetical protein [Bacillaceae]ALC84431.1 hypothetical protein AM499_00310 [Bacillus sp. FJAT-22090]KQL33230.1 hypothetical protein AN959_16800 [Psychrobacillus sp. FJAT-21963]
MKKNTKFALLVSLFVLIGIPLFFLLISLLTNERNYFLYSIFPSFAAGFTGLIISVQQIKKERKSL